MTFDDVRTEAAQHLLRLQGAAQASRGPFRAPDIDLTSDAHRHLAQDVNIETPGFPSPIAHTLGHVERLLVAGDDQIRCVADLLRGPEVSWFGHLAVIRAAVEALSRSWYLVEPGISAVERATRLANEHLAEMHHMSSMLASQLKDLPDEIVEAAKRHLGETRAGLNAWAKEHAVANLGGYLGSGRPRPLDLVAMVYQQDGGADAAAIGAWRYSTLSSPAHGLPEGISQYLVNAEVGNENAHPHLVLTQEQLLGSVEPLLTVHEATTLRLAQFFRWPISDALRAEALAARMFFNRAGGLI